MTASSSSPPGSPTDDQLRDRVREGLQAGRTPAELLEQLQTEGVESERAIGIIKNPRKPKPAISAGRDFLVGFLFLGIGFAGFGYWFLDRLEKNGGRASLAGNLAMTVGWVSIYGLVRITRGVAKEIGE